MSRQKSSFDVDKHEFLCPLCQRLSNTVLPLVAPLANYAALLEQVEPTSPELPSVSMETWDAALSAVSRLAVSTKSNVLYSNLSFTRTKVSTFSVKCWEKELSSWKIFRTIRKLHYAS